MFPIYFQLHSEVLLQYLNLHVSRIEIHQLTWISLNGDNLSE